MQVLVIPTLSDNYTYYLYHPLRPENGLYIDLARAQSVLDCRKLLGLPELKSGDLVTILTTHKHWDHSQGNVELPNLVPGLNLRVYGSKTDHVPGCTVVLDYSDSEDRVINLDVSDTEFGAKIRAINAPCHSAGSVLYDVESSDPISVEPVQEIILEHFEAPPGQHVKTKQYKLVKNVRRCVFTGDTVFIGGCGKFFEGEATQMLSNMDLFTGTETKEAYFPDDTLIFPGHEYSADNLKFCLSVVGDNICPEQEIMVMYHEKFRELGHRESPIPTVPSVLKNEKKYNLFMMCR